MEILIGIFVGLVLLDSALVRWRYHKLRQHLDVLNERNDALNKLADHAHELIESQQKAMEWRNDFIKSTIARNILKHPWREPDKEEIN